MIRIREFNMEKDLKSVEELEMGCDVGLSSNKLKKKKKKREGVSLSVDLLGDPLCRVRHVQDHTMLVAEYGDNKEIVGVIRACVKNVTRCKSERTCRRITEYVRIAYILGLRVSPMHRRLGIGTKLVQRVESWCVQKGAEYAYIATDRSNTPSLNLFTRRLSYTPFRSLTILAQPVHAHPLTLSKTTIISLTPSISIPLYRNLFSNSEFFPSDIDTLLTHPLTLGTFFAFRHDLPRSFAIMSLWDGKQVFRMKFSGASRVTRNVVKWTRAADKLMPRLKIPSVSDVFRPFGVYLMYGIYVEGEGGSELLRSLCRFAHNMAMKDKEIAAVVAEVGGSDDGVKDGVLHWRRISCEEDVWCMKRLVDEEEVNDEVDDWSKSRPSTNVIFVDPREF